MKDFNNLFICVTFNRIIESMIYGNPTYKIVHSLKNSILVREWSRLGVFTGLKMVPYPDEIMTQRELWYMVDLQKNVDSMRLERIKLYDVTLYETMVEFLTSYGVTTTLEEIKQQLDPYEPIVDYLKVMYNRPRPFQTFQCAVQPTLEKLNLHGVLVTNLNISGNLG